MNTKRRPRKEQGIPEEVVGEQAVYGTPEDVAKEIELFKEVGLQYFIVQLDPSTELEALYILADNIMKRS